MSTTTRRPCIFRSLVGLSTALLVAVVSACGADSNGGDPADDAPDGAQLGDAGTQFDTGVGNDAETGAADADTCCGYYVGGPGASDTNPGTAAAPFATIQKAASVVAAGEFVRIRSGTYRETIVPASSGSDGKPITYQADAGATVLISGLDALDDGGWSVHNGSIYKKSVTLPVNGYNASTDNNETILANQIFDKGEMMFEARWPKVGKFEDLFDRSKLRHKSSMVTFQPTYLQDNGLPIPAPGLTGATIVTNGWFATESKTITSHSGNQLDYASIWDNTTNGIQTRKRYFLTGKLALLTQAKEWHYESGTLYFWQADGGIPSGLEYKARNWCFDLRGKSNITVQGLTFKGCEPVVGDTESVNTTLDGIEASYMNHHIRHDIWEWQGVGMCKQLGTKLLGANSVIKNSVLHSSGSQGVWLGPNGRAENNLMHDIGYVGNWAAPISLWDRDGGQVITRNTIYRTGRSSFDFGYNWNGEHFDVEVSYNDFSSYGLMSSDLGATYTWGQADLTGLDYHHNWIHDTAALNGDEGEYGIQVCIYFDQATGPGTLHHNVTWNCKDSDIYHEVINSERTTNTLLKIYNNTLATSSPAVSSYRTYITSPSDIQRNNIYRLPVIINWGAGPGDVASSLLYNQNPQFINTGEGGLAFRVSSTSPAVDNGMVIEGITDGYLGTAPDMGAYESDGPAWTAGRIAP